MATTYDAWGGSFGTPSAWNLSWHVSTAAPAPTPATPVVAPTGPPTLGGVQELGWPTKREREFYEEIEEILRDGWDEDDEDLILIATAIDFHTRL